MLGNNAVARHPPRVTVWSLVPTPTLADVSHGQLARLLSLEERERAGRYRFARDQQLSVAARGLLRLALSHHAAEQGQDVAPTDWRFAAGERGKPHLAGPTAHDLLRFNVAHSEGMVVCAVAPGRDETGDSVATVGVDVEPSDRRTNYHPLARRYFAPHEATQVTAVGDDEVAARFFAIWTLKEAYVKALGSGLAHGLTSFWFTTEQSPEPQIVFAPGADKEGDVHRWSFAQRAVGLHLVAAGARVLSGSPAVFSFQPPGLPPD